MDLWIVGLLVGKVEQKKFLVTIGYRELPWVTEMGVLVSGSVTVNHHGAIIRGL
jgi:hypothetical protein